LAGADFRTNSAGAEGEWQVVGDHVMSSFAPVDVPEEVNISNQSPLPLELALAALRDFGECYRIDAHLDTTRNPRYWEDVVVLCDSAQVKALAERSYVHRYLVESARLAQARAGVHGAVKCVHDR
jgi:hypothetical protein